MFVASMAVTACASKVYTGEDTKTNLEKKGIQSGFNE